MDIPLFPPPCLLMVFLTLQQLIAILLSQYKSLRGWLLAPHENLLFKKIQN